MIVGMQNATTDMRSYGAARMQIRPLTAADRGLPADEFSHLSEQTRRRRFGGPATRLSERGLDRLADIDDRNHQAPAAIEPGDAEVAAEVDDEWQSRGLGRRLIHELVGRARAEGFTRLPASVSTGNLPVLEWTARAGGTVESHGGDTTLYNIPRGLAGTDRRAA
jgi:acetyltransferase